MRHYVSLPKLWPYTMSSVASSFQANEPAAESHIETLLETLKSFISGTPIEFLKTRELRPDIQALSAAERMQLLYSRVADYTTAVSSLTVCANQMMKSAGGGCLSSACCKMAPDVYSLERQRLDALPPAANRAPGYCGFFDQAVRTCTVYEHRPLACRIFANFTNNIDNCSKASRAVNDAKAISIFVPPFLGEYTGPYVA